MSAPLSVQAVLVNVDQLTESTDYNFLVSGNDGEPGSPEQQFWAFMASNIDGVAGTLDVEIKNMPNTTSPDLIVEPSLQIAALDQATVAGTAIKDEVYCETIGPRIQVSVTVSAPEVLGQVSVVLASNLPFSVTAIS